MKEIWIKLSSSYIVCSVSGSFETTCILVSSPLGPVRSLRLGPVLLILQELQRLHARPCRWETVELSWGAQVGAQVLPPRCTALSRACLGHPWPWKHFNWMQRPEILFWQQQRRLLNREAFSVGNSYIEDLSFLPNREAASDEQL